MQRFSNVQVGLTALFFFASIGTSTALAQQTPTLSLSGSAPEQPATAQTKSGAVALRPVAPPPAVVVDLGAEPAGGIAKIVPPAPKIAARGKVFISRPSGAYSTKLAAASSSLKVNSNFGWRRDPFSGRGRRHTGVDIDGEWGESVGASMAGTVSFVGVKRGYGNVIIVDHGQGLSTYYAHLSSMAVSVGQTVAAGQTIGFIGSTGRSSGPHLHYELRALGHPVNPYATVAIDGQRVFVDGKPVQTAPLTDGSGDEPEPTVVIREGDRATQPAASRPRTLAKGATTTPPKPQHVVVVTENSMTQY